jgi:hypothetical protein
MSYNPYLNTISCLIYRHLLALLLLQILFRELLVYNQTMIIGLPLINLPTADGLMTYQTFDNFVCANSNRGNH